MFNLLAFMVAAVLPFGCGNTVRTDLERSTMAGQALKKAEAEIDLLRSKPSLSSTNKALEYITPFLERPDLLATPVRRDSFSVTDQRETNIPGPSAFEQILSYIACAYEQNGRWDQACDVWSKAITFADGWNKSHANANRTDYADRLVSDSRLLFLYSNLARSYWLGGHLDEAVKTLQAAIAKQLPEAGQSQSALLVQLVYYLSHGSKSDQMQPALQQIDKRVTKLEADYQAGHRNEMAIVCNTEALNLRTDARASVEMKDARLDALPTMATVLSIGRKRALNPDSHIFLTPLPF